MHKIVGILLVLFSASTFADSPGGDLSKPVKNASIAEQARILIDECRDRAISSSESLQFATSGKDELARYTRVVIEATCISEVLHNNGKKK